LSSPAIAASIWTSLMISVFPLSKPEVGVFSVEVSTLAAAEILPFVVI